MDCSLAASQCSTETLPRGLKLGHPARLAPVAPPRELLLMPLHNNIMRQESLFCLSATSARGDGATRWRSRPSSRASSSASRLSWPRTSAPAVRAERVGLRAQQNVHVLAHDFLQLFAEQKARGLARHRTTCRGAESRPRRHVACACEHVLAWHVLGMREQFV